MQEELFHTDITTALFAEVIIPLALPTTYTWRIPQHFQQSVTIGIRVEVQLRNKKYSGIIRSLHKEKPSAFEPKEILNVLDDEPLLYPQQLQLWQWLANYYLCSEGEVMQAAIPSNLKLSSESVLIYNEEFGVDYSSLNDEEFIVAEALELKKELRLSEVQQLLDISHVYPVIKKLIDKGVCFIWEELKEKYKEKKENFVILTATYHNEDKLADLLNNWSKAPRQMELLLAYLHLLKTNGEVKQSDLLKKANASLAQLKGLQDKGVVRIEARSVNRLKPINEKEKSGFSLSPAQQNALAGIQENFTEKNTCLLHGVTASGKTQIYIKLIESVIEKGEQVLYMLPEIALTAQIIRRLQEYFGNSIAVYHSKFNPNERVELWNKVKEGTIKIVLGARSALFLPFKHIGLIIIDEEHDASYKQQDPAPRYNARDAAIYYASLFNAKVLLGSATPSVDTYYNCIHNKYGLVELTERFGNVSLPAIEIIDLKKTVQQQKEKIVLTQPLKEAIAQSLHEKKQIIIFQNRRGYSPYILCNTCGWIPQCKHCDVTLTYHKSKNTLSCHYCGTSYPVLQTCAACGSHNFIQKNFGTEKIEELIAETFSDAKTARMDYDTVKGKHDHDALIRLFEQQRIDILVGTQMVVKGLDFEHVNLVGITDADGILNFADFRVNERAFQLMEQVSGRAGRKDGNGKVLIQVSNVQHPVLHFVKEHNYKQFFEHEILARKMYHYPPYSRIINIVFKHKLNHIAEEAANIMKGGLSSAFGLYIKGPAQPMVNRIRNQYLWELQLKLPKNTALIQHCKTAILQQSTIIQSNKQYSAVSIIADVDPV